MAAMRPTVQGRPAWLKMALAVGIGVVAALVLVLGNQLLRGNKETPGVVRNPVVKLSGIPQDDRVLGSSKAKVTLIEFADQQCPGCRYYSLNVFPALVKEYVKPGKVKMHYQGYPFIGRDSMKALKFLLAAAEQDRLWQLQEALYRYQGRENSGWITDDLIRQLASEIPGLDVDKLFADAQSASIAKEANADLATAEAANLPGTPTFFVQIGSRKPYYVDVSSADQFRSALDDALEG
jgi:protein-disulfide isomerase